MKASRKVLSAFLALVMAVSMLSVSAFAAGNGYSLSPYDSNVTTLEISGVNVNSYTRASEPMTTGSSNIRVTYNIVLAANVSQTAAANIDFTVPSTNLVSAAPPNGQPGQWIPIINANASNTYSVTLENGVATKTVYVHKNFPATYQNCDIYTFNFTIGTYNNPVMTTSGISLRFGDPLYPNTEPECYMSFNGSGNDYTAVYAGPKANYYPDVLALKVASSDDTNITRLTGNGVEFAVYDASGDKATYTSITENINGSDTYTVEIGAAGGTVTIAKGASSSTVTFLAPQQAVSAGGTAPKYVNGYLPLGQYASGAAWGSIFTNYTNAAGLAASDAVTKVTSGLSSTGISLGAPGGYVQFEFENAVSNDPNNKYGVDFVIYGNPFNGNPEAASVKVSEDGVNWYELAGSRYYAEETLHNATLTYTKESDGIHYAINGVDKGVYKNAPAWWPEASEGYDGVAGVNSLFQGTKQVSGVTYSGNTITFTGLNLVKDTDTTDDYLFGYADVRQVGSTKDGTACNPYTSLPSGATSSMVGGDGFDISWAVNADGTPKALDSIKYVRVYTSAALDPNNLTAMPTPGIFGETSAEVCGVFVAKETTTETTELPTISISESQLDFADAQEVSDNIFFFEYGLTSGEEVSVTAGNDDNIFINGSTSGNYTVSSNTYGVQVIVQSGEAEPIIAVIK